MSGARPFRLWVAGRKQWLLACACADETEVMQARESDPRLQRYLDDVVYVSYGIGKRRRYDHWTAEVEARDRTPRLF